MLLSVFFVHTSKSYISIHFGNYVRLVSSIMSGFIVTYILANHLILTFQSFTLIYPIFLSVMISVIHVRWDFKLAPMFITSILTFPANILLCYVNPAIVLINSPLNTLFLLYATVMGVIIFIDLNPDWLVKYFINNVSNKLKFIDPFIVTFKDKSSLVTSSMTATIFTMMNLIYFLSLGYDKTFANLFLIIFLFTLILIYIIIGIRLLNISQNVYYKYNFMFEIIINIIKNINNVRNQMNSNIIPTPNKYVKYFVILMSLAFSSTSYASGFETSNDLLGTSDSIEPKSPAAIFDPSEFNDKTTITKKDRV